MSTDKYGFRNLVFCDSFNDLVDDLTKSNKPLRFFDNMYELFIMAACIGYSRKLKVAAIKNGKSIEFNQFRTFDNFEGIFLAICLAHSKSADILVDDESKIADRLNLFSEYANGGMEVIRDEILVGEGQVEDRFIRYLNLNGTGFSARPKGEFSRSKFAHIFDGVDSAD